MANGERKPWDKEAAITLRKEGKTTGQIAALLGVTRNMVVGLLNRKQMIGVGAPPAMRQVKAPKPPPHPKPIKVKKAAKPVPAPPPPKTASPVTVGIKKYSRDDVSVSIERGADDQGLMILQLGRNQCRCAISPHYVDKHSHIFCGNKCESGEMYCDSHRKKLYKTMRQFKKRPKKPENCFEQQKVTI